MFERGDVDDIRNCRRYYGDERVRQALTNAKWMPKESVYLACAILDYELTDYRCSRSYLLNPQQWGY
ncbi:hypothetical protein [Parasediminibacterium sp. JCM 36343]|uniref:hypothetical protein n=1 Tax=Parasediminibacterium sp. JCM 36343 TaxID=3374279 RepID=UPI00397D968A